MLETYSLTQTLALLFGLYMASAGIGLITDSKGFSGVMEEFKSSTGLTYIAAIAALALGGTDVAIHNIWGNPLEIIVTLFGWAALIEGALMLAFRRTFLTLVGAMPLNERFMKGYGVFVLLVALALFALVFVT